MKEESVGRQLVGELQGTVLRTLGRDRSLTAAVLVNVAFVVALDAAIFAVVESVLVAELPYPAPEELHEVRVVGDRDEELLDTWTLAEWNAAPGGTRLAGYRPGRFSLGALDRTVRVDGAEVTPEYFSVLGTEALAGRVFTPADGGAGAQVMISEGFWEKAYSRRLEPGDTLLVDGREHVLVGVMPGSFTHPAEGSDLWVKIEPEPLISETGIALQYLPVIARVKGNVPAAEATGSSLLEAAIAAQGLTTPKPVVLQPLRERLVGDVRHGLWALSAAGLAVLLIAAANLGLALLARWTAREREVATRLALGAGVGRIARSIVAEALVLGTLGGLVGLLVAWASQARLRALLRAEIPRVSEIRVDWQAAGWTLTGTLVLLSVVAAGPAVGTALRTDPARLLGRAGGRGRKASRLQRVFVFLEAALAVLLLGTSLSAGRALVEQVSISVGMETGGLESFEVFRESRHGGAAFLETLVRRLRQHPGVADACAVRFLPLSPEVGLTSFAMPGRENERLIATLQFADGQFPATAGIPVLSGRWASGSGEAVIDEAFARRYLAGGRSSVAASGSDPQRSRSSAWSGAFVSSVPGSSPSRPSTSSPRRRRRPGSSRSRPECSSGAGAARSRNRPCSSWSGTSSRRSPSPRSSGSTSGSGWLPGASGS